MPQQLLIVESPAKAKTINKYLGDTFKVIASFGHIRSLPTKSGSIDTAHNFAPNYQIIAKNKKHVDEILASGKDATQIYLATDPDREGEAIAWHIAEILKQNKKTAKIPITRVTFHEITKLAILDAINHPRDLDMNMVEAQEARMTLDYLMGFNISPLLWRKIRPGLSAGRVQSPALRLICEREIEIKNFIPEDYFCVKLLTKKNTTPITARLVEYTSVKDGALHIQKIETKTINQKIMAQEICDILSKNDKNKIAIVHNITKKEKKKNALPPFITSSLQIEASRRLGSNADKTMRVAQSLYEGIDIGHETIGLISYMRTDSVNLSEQALSDIREYIQQNYAPEFLPQAANKFVSKVKNAQEAHEAIRPTNIKLTPESLKKHLTPDQYKLYELIWLRALASQFAPAILDTTAIDFKVATDNNEYSGYSGYSGIFRANGIVIKFPGFLKVYNEEKGEQGERYGQNSSISATTANQNSNNNSTNDNDDANNATILPPLTLNEELPVNQIDFTEHQTEPKPRYSEASLLKTLEDLGIGRPSTYAGIFSTLKKREYVIMDKKRFIPTDIGSIVSQFLANHLTQYVDYQFTAHLEDTLDNISNGQTKKLPVLQKFWQELTQIIKEKQEIPRDDLTGEKLDENCPECGKQLLIRLGKYGKFIACSGYPECKYMRKLSTGGADGDEVVKIEPEIIEGRTCPKDDGVLVIRTGRYGKFISCKNYPKCKFIENLDQPADDGSQITCPECKTGHIVTKKNRYGNWFYACNRYPECKTLFNHKPLDEKCPNSECDSPILLHKITKRYGEQKVCPKCDFCENINSTIDDKAV
jgi:DNA topoisomerase-1